jgi:hypothetical protein
MVPSCRPSSAFPPRLSQSSFITVTQCSTSSSLWPTLTSKYGCTNSTAPICAPLPDVVLDRAVGSSLSFYQPLLRSGPALDLLVARCHLWERVHFDMLPGDMHLLDPVYQISRVIGRAILRLPEAVAGIQRCWCRRVNFRDSRSFLTELNYACSQISEVHLCLFAICNGSVPSVDTLQAVVTHLDLYSLRHPPSLPADEMLLLPRVRDLIL